MIRFTWVHDPRWATWEVTFGPCSVSIQPRPAYCDRGNWVATADSTKPYDLDGADGFPRYYMDLERAKAELEDWMLKRYRSYL